MCSHFIMRIEEIVSMAEKLVGRGFATFSFLVLFCMNLVLATGVNALQVGNQWTGPWVVKIVYKVVQDDVEGFLALLDGEVDILGCPLPKVDVLEYPEDLEVSDVLRLGYGIIYINCDKYPMNITNFRRAVSFALDKHRVIEDGWLGLAQLLDCHIPMQHPASIEEEMEYHYYDENIAEGARLLALEGFVDSDDDGWLEGPGPKGPGTIELDTIIVEGHQNTQIDIFLDTVVQALLSLNISVDVRHFEDREYWKYYADFDMEFHYFDWHSLDLDFYARDMSTEFINTGFYNKPDWSNETWDLYAEIVLHSTDYDEIIETVKKMEEIWVHSCPGIVMFQNSRYTAYRTHRFEGVTPTILEGAPNFYTNLRVHQKTGDIYGGTYTWANPLDILSFNHYSWNTAYADNILQMLFDPLVRIGPDGNDILWLCDDFTIQTHDDDSSVSEGHTRITVDIVQNATWSDGTPITADDVAFSLNFMRDCVPVVNAELIDMVTCYAPSTFKLLCEFDSESFWHWHAISYKSIIPSQIWVDYTDAYDEYQPLPANISEMVLSGPFLPTTWKQGEYTELVQNPYYFRNPRLLPDTPTASQTTTSDNTTDFITKGIVSRQTQGFIIGISCAVAIIIILDFIRRRGILGGDIIE